MLFLEEDGVRLGCYGYVHPNGKAYSTHYVADNRGYRIVPHQGEILVYPKDGTVARMASFFESFNEDEIKSSNIRYFFPNGCKSTMIDIKLVDPSVTPKPYVSSQFSAKLNGDLKTVPVVATTINQDNKNFPTNIIPIVTGTVIQTKLNQNKDNKSSKGGTANTIERVPTDNGSGNVGKNTNNAKLNSEKNTQNSEIISSVGTDKNNRNQNNNNNENHNKNNDENHNDNSDGDHKGNSDNHHNDNSDNHHNGNSDEHHNDKSDKHHNGNSGGDHNSGPSHHTIPIYSRTSENSSGNPSSKNITGKSLDNKYLPTGEMEIEEPEKNEFLKIVQTPSTLIVQVTSSTPINAIIPSSPIVPISPPKTIASVSPSKPIIPTASSNQSIPVSSPKEIVAADINNQCQDCCEDTHRPTILMTRNSETTCCKKDVAKLSIPISMEKLAKIAMTELIEITSETNTINMLKKLLALAEKYQF